MGRGALDDEEICFCHGNLDIAANFLPGVLEATPPAQTDLFRYWRGRNWFQSVNWII